MDSHYLPALGVLGWALLTLGVWGAVGRPWWLWPLSGGLGLLVVVAGGLVVYYLQARAAAAAAAKRPARVAEMPARPGAAPEERAA